MTNRENAQAQEGLEAEDDVEEPEEEERRLIAVTPCDGEWFAMMRTDDSPDCAFAVRIAAWGLYSDGTSGALIPDEDPCGSSRIIEPPKAMCCGITDAAGARDVNWQDIAREHAKLEALEEARELLTDEHVERVYKNLTDSEKRGFNALDAHDIYDILDGLLNKTGFYWNEKRLHALNEQDAIEAVEGGYRITKFGEMLLPYARDKREPANAF